ncbi:MAG: flotillin-like protein FloA [Verrucomicrobiae bacterium]|nr:flotillin-like protein FloA [Verrucomicrobiae bacterium]
MPLGELITVGLLGLLAIVGLVVILVLLNFGAIWIRAWSSGAPVGFMELISLKLRKVPVGMVVDARINAIKSGLRVRDESSGDRKVAIDDLSTHYLAGGNVMMVIQALINAQKAGIHLDFDRGCAIDLATKGTGKNVIEAVKTSINPRVIDCPNPNSGKNTIDAVAKDGIAVKVKARVTVRTNLERFVGGATEDTIVARVGEGIVTTIGSSTTYKDVLENPDRISNTVLSKALDSNTAFEILSIDIADIDIGENIGAKLQSEQAEANKLKAQAEAEVRRANAVAQEQEMLARVAEMRARVVEAEAQVPLAMAEAFRAGNLGIMDYYRMKNVQADTTMRESIAGPTSSAAQDAKI